jgi:hypothetical protein
MREIRGLIRALASRIKNSKLFAGICEASIREGRNDDKKQEVEEEEADQWAARKFSSHSFDGNSVRRYRALPRHKIV